MSEEEKKYPMPRNVRIPEPMDTQIQEMADWHTNGKVSPIILDALREYVKNHYKEFKKEAQAFQKSIAE